MIRIGLIGEGHYFILRSYFVTTFVSLDNQLKYSQNISRQNTKSPHFI